MGSKGFQKGFNKGKKGFKKVQKGSNESRKGSKMGLKCVICQVKTCIEKILKRLKQAQLKKGRDKQ